MSRAPYTPEYPSSSDSDASSIETLQLRPTRADLSGPGFSPPATPGPGPSSYTFEAPSSGPVRSSPIVGTQAEHKAHRIHKGARKGHKHSSLEES